MYFLTLVFHFSVYFVSCYLLSLISSVHIKLIANKLRYYQPVYSHTIYPYVFGTPKCDKCRKFCRFISICG